jgi:ABC-type transport system involved in multi-copper enzyme maturation permease subunit
LNDRPGEKMKKIYVLASSTFKDILRKKILYFIFIAAILAIFSANLVTFFKESLQVRLIKDLVFGMISIFSIFLGLFLSHDLIRSEIDSKAVYYVLSRPVERWQYILGKTIGLFIVLIMNTLFIGIAFACVMFVKKGTVPVNTFSGIYFITLKTLVIASFSILLSTMTTRIINISFSVLIYFTLNFREMINYFLLKSNMHIVKPIVEGLLYFLPNFHFISMNTRVIHNFDIKVVTLFSSGLYALAWITLFTGISVVVFSRKDL